MDDENGSNERPERSEGSSRKGAPPPASNSKMISVVVGIVVLLVAMLQFMRISQRQMEQLYLEEKIHQSRAQEEFRAKAQKKRFDTIENNKQADMLESQFQPLNQTGHPREP
ncbi:MAG: hypothetical protein G8237_13755 [Magnetococcales bacterium]|nr:hypothetical protein [Magnetococcales bacterium]NGZ07410.1 hypothetical protein [Magnetococcales bacterium]